MAYRAIIRRLFLAVAAYATSHAVIDDALGDGSLGHVAMTRRAFDLGPNVGRMLELNQRLTRKRVNTLPGYFTLGFRISDQLLDLRLGVSHLGMTQHAFLDRRNRSGGAGVGGAMTIEALQSERNVLFMGVRDRLGRVERTCP